MLRSSFRLGDLSRYPAQANAFSTFHTVSGYRSCSIYCFRLIAQEYRCSIVSVDFETLYQHDVLWNEIPLSDLYDESAVIVYDNEIISYNWERQEINVSASGIGRLPRRTHGHADYFIVALNSTPCFLGCIENRRSSDAKNIPTIYVRDILNAETKSSGFIPIRKGHFEKIFNIPRSKDKRFHEGLKEYLERTGRLSNPAG